MSLNYLPTEMVLKIANFLPNDKDFVSFTLANRKTFHIFSRENILWRQRLDEDDQLMSDALEDDQPMSCPAKEIFFRRSKSEQNWRKNNFKVVDTCALPNVDYRTYMRNTRSKCFQDFFVRLQEVGLNCWHIAWVDVSEGNAIRSGSLSRPEPVGDRVIHDVFVASNKLLIVCGREGTKGENDTSEFLVAIDLTRKEDLRILWETRRQVDGSSIYWPPKSVVVVNSKIYQKKINQAGISHIDVISSETGKTLSTLKLKLNGPLRELYEPGCREVKDGVKWIVIRTEEEIRIGEYKEQLLILDLETNEVRTIHQVIDNKSKSIVFQRIDFSQEFLYVNEYVKEDGAEDNGLPRTHKVFRIPSGELLIQEKNSHHLCFEFDLGEGGIHLWKEDRPAAPTDWTIATFNSTEASRPKFFYSAQHNRSRNFCDGHNIVITKVMYSSFVVPENERGVLSLSVEPFGTGSEALSRKIRKRKLDLETEEEILFTPWMFVTRSKAILVVGHENSAELVLLDFAL